MSTHNRFWLHVGAVHFCVLILSNTMVTAQPCVGDCNGNGQVGIGELILGVRIALGESDAEDCPAFDPPVSIGDLIRAVRAALNGCPAEPSRSATSTATDTPTATPTDTPTPTPTDTPTATPTDTATPTPTDTATPGPVAVWGVFRWGGQPWGP